MDRQSRKVNIVVLGLLIVYLATRFVVMPRDLSVTPVFSHDSGYICIVAEQLLAGRGYVNPAHWLVFLNPPRLPIPYHNANPGYPTVVAATAWLMGIDVVRAAIAVNILSSGLLASFVYLLVKSYCPEWKAALTAAVAVVVAPEIWQSTYRILPDALMAALSVGVIALLCARIPRPWNWIAAGLLFGLAWLVRSTALLLIPPILFGSIRRDGLSRTIVNLVMFLIAVGLVVSPWLIHTQRVWGSPFRSDAGYYWLQGYYARAYGGDVEKYWRSLTPPPSLGEVLRTDLVGFTTYLVQSLPQLVYMILAGLALWSKPFLAALIVGFAAAMWLGHCHLRTWEWQAGALLLLLNSLSLLPRASSAEIRYLMVSLALIAIWMGVLLFEGVIAWRAGRASNLDEIAVLLLSCTAIACVGMDVKASLELAKTNPVQIQLREVVKQTARIASRTPVVVHNPYFYTFYTHGAPALEPHYTDKSGLLAYMSRYGAQYLLVQPDQFAKLFTGDSSQFEPEFSVYYCLDSYMLLKRN